jgi:hypothetical protein
MRNNGGDPVVVVTVTVGPRYGRLQMHDGWRHAGASANHRHSSQ